MDDHISASQLSTWLRCPKQYEFRYMQGLKIAPKSALTRGSAFHKAIETDHRQKISTRENLPIADVLDAYSDAFEQMATETEWDKNPGEVKDQGIKMTQVYHESVSRVIQPVAVEEESNIIIDGQLVKAIIDLETEDGAIRDAKSAGAKKSEIPVDHLLQMAIYSHAKPNATRFILDNAIVTKSGKSELESLTLTRAELPYSRLSAYLEDFSDSIIKGVFPPTNPSSWVCSAEWCGYWDKCSCGGKQ